MSPFKFFIALIWFVAASWAQADSYKQKLRTFHTPQEFQQITVGKVQINRTLDPQQQIALRLQPLQKAPQIRPRHEQTPSATLHNVRRMLTSHPTPRQRPPHGPPRNYLPSHTDCLPQ